MIEKIRMIKYDDLNDLLALYRFLNHDDTELTVDESLNEHWNKIIDDPNYFYLGVEEEGVLVSTCNLTVIKNLTRSARPYGLIENVVTHPDYRKRGYGTALLKMAIKIAGEKGCYKVMLMTSKKDEDTLNFYRKAGFNSQEKTGFIVRL